MTIRLTDTKHNHNYQNYHKNNPQDKLLKKIQIDDLKKLNHIKGQDTLSQKYELQFHL